MERAPLGSLDAVTIDCLDPHALASFWCSVFATEIDTIEGDPAQYIDLLPAAGAPTIRLQRVPEPKTVKDRIHLDLMVDDVDLAVGRAVELGAQKVNGHQLREHGVRFVVMLDPEGNEFCLTSREE
jgi:predicted enzyme related to lactoylglutathione lyase